MFEEMSKGFVLVLKVFVVNSIRKCLKMSTYELISKGFALDMLT